jgi:hypothetical protein
MIFVTHQLPVNVPGEPFLDRSAVKAVAATLNAMRRLAQDAVSA